MRKAAVDVGSNSVLLTVEEHDGCSWRQIFESSEVTGLGEGTRETGLLSDQAIARTLAAVKRAFCHAEGLGVVETLAATTMAARIASNAHVFLHRAVAQGTPIFVLAADDEAELGFRSVADDPLFSAEPRLSILDPGGHSTEIVTAYRTGDAWSIRFRRSYPVGTLGLRGGVLAGESPGADRIIAAVEQIDETIGFRSLPGAAGKLVLLGATGTNLVSLRDRLEGWQPERVHGVSLSFEEVSRAVEKLMPMSDADRAALPGLEHGRERTIHIGALIVERFMHAAGVGECAVSVRGWRHALLETGLPNRA